MKRRRVPEPPGILDFVLLGLGEQRAAKSSKGADYLDAEFEEPYRYELVRGRLAVVMSPNSEEHDDAADP